MPKKPKPLEKTWLPKREAQARRKVNNSKLYQSRRWRQFRLRYLKNNPLCVECEKEGRVVRANVLDHIKQVIKGGEFYDVNNVQGLCTTCHNKKSGREAHHHRKG
jgi:5-methylcytosine-specific restriction protein A